MRDRDRQERREDERREGFGDDQGTRIGRPDVTRGPSSQPVKEGLEGAIFEEDDPNMKKPSQ
jgi:hypothetical protein